MEEAFRVGLGRMDVPSATGEEEKDAEWEDDNYEDNGAYDYDDAQNQASEGSTTIPEAQQLLPGLFISDYSVAKSEEALHKYQITHILSVAPLDEVFSLEEQFVYKTIPWRETDLEDILPDFDVCFNFIDKARDGNGICLVHCSDGVSRSGAIAIAYIMRTKQISLKEANEYVVSKRSCVQPNSGFMDQLATFEKTLKEETA